MADNRQWIKNGKYEMKGLLEMTIKTTFRVKARLDDKKSSSYLIILRVQTILNLLESYLLNSL